MVVSPDFDPPLECPQKLIRIDARIFSLQCFEYLPRSRCGRCREPPIEIARDCRKRINPGSPRSFSEPRPTNSLRRLEHCSLRRPVAPFPRTARSARSIVAALIVSTPVLTSGAKSIWPCRSIGQVGSYLGLVSIPWQSGGVRRDQGITRGTIPFCR